MDKLNNTLNNALKELIRIFSPLFKDWTMLDVLIYIVILSLFKFAQGMEVSDLKCPWHKCPDGLCREGNGTPYYGTEVEKGDTKEIIVEKINTAANVHRKTVYWRRTLIITFLTTLISSLILYERLPRGKELLVILAVSGGAWYFSFNYYNFHHFDHARNRIQSLVKAL